MGSTAQSSKHYAINPAEQELARCLQPLLDELPARYRHALTLAEFEGMTQAEIASREGLSLSGAGTRQRMAWPFTFGVRSSSRR